MPNISVCLGVEKEAARGIQGCRNVGFWEEQSNLVFKPCSLQALLQWKGRLATERESPLRQVHIHNPSTAYTLGVRMISTDGLNQQSVYAKPLQCRHTSNAREENEDK